MINSEILSIIIVCDKIQPFMSFIMWNHTIWQYFFNLTEIFVQLFNYCLFILALDFSLSLLFVCIFLKFIFVFVALFIIICNKLSHIAENITIIYILYIYFSFHHPFNTFLLLSNNSNFPSLVMINVYALI